MRQEHIQNMQLRTIQGSKKSPIKETIRSAPHSAKRSAI